jgi:CBS domain-containing protein
MRGLLVESVMTRDIYAVAPDTDLETVGALFAMSHISGAPVVDAAARPIGMISKTDLIVPRSSRTGSSPRGKPIYYRIRGGLIHSVGTPRDGAAVSAAVAGDVMSSFVFTIGPRAPLVDAMRLMVSEEVHRLVVVDGGRLVGIVSSIDVLRAALRWSDAEVSAPVAHAGG